MPTVPGSKFPKLKCDICGRYIAINGFAQYQHNKMHERELELSKINAAQREADHNKGKDWRKIKRKEK